jgi:hypothetical protein
VVEGSGAVRGSFCQAFSAEEALGYSIHCRMLDRDRLVSDFGKYLGKPA